MLLPKLPSVDVNSLVDKYRTSQYCLSGYRDQHGWDSLTPQYSYYCGDGIEFTGNLDDPELYTLAGWEYVRGADPASLNPELQPLGKYLFGLAILVFKTPLPVQYLSLAFVLIFTYLLARRLLPPVLSLIPPALLLTQGLIQEQLTNPYLDLFQTAAILGYLYFFPRRHLAAVLLGVVALSKSFSIGILLAVVSALYLYLFDRRQLLPYLRSLWLSLVVYFVGYTMFFLAGHSPQDFAKLHLAILRLYRSYVPEYPKFEIFRIIFTGRWREWYADHTLIPAPNWSLLWPLSLVGSLFALFFRRHRQILLHLSWIICYLLFLSLRLPFPRYIIPILPSLFILAIYPAYTFSRRLTFG